MATVRFAMNRNAPRELRRLAKTRAELVKKAEAIARAAGEGHEVDSEIGRNRARASVRTTTIDAMLDEAIDHNLTRAFDAGRR